eukprot:m.302948 g.302948  ORF g.302948 m.302948 type:complete len:449 (+) comp40832_c0_seq1:3261-4607(+)
MPTERPSHAPTDTTVWNQKRLARNVPLDTVAWHNTNHQHAALPDITPLSDNPAALSVQLDHTVPTGLSLLPFPVPPDISQQLKALKCALNAALATAVRILISNLSHASLDIMPLPKHRQTALNVRPGITQPETEQSLASNVRPAQNAPTLTNIQNCATADSTRRQDPCSVTLVRAEGRALIPVPSQLNAIWENSATERIAFNVQRDSSAPKLSSNRFPALTDSIQTTLEQLIAICVLPPTPASTSPSHRFLAPRHIIALEANLAARNARLALSARNRRPTALNVRPGRHALTGLCPCRRPIAPPARTVRSAPDDAARVPWERSAMKGPTYVPSVLGDTSVRIRLSRRSFAWSALGAPAEDCSLAFRVRRDFNVSRPLLRPKGTYSLAGNGSCLQCPAGMSCLNPAKAPVSCKAGEYSPPGFSECRVCPAGYNCSSASDDNDVPADFSL